MAPVRCCAASAALQQGQVQCQLTSCEEKRWGYTVAHSTSGLAAVGSSVAAATRGGQCSVHVLSSLL